MYKKPTVVDQKRFELSQLNVKSISLKGLARVGISRLSNEHEISLNFL